MRVTASLVLAGLAALAAAGAPTPAEALLIASGAGAGATPAPLALVGAWLGYSAGDALAFALLRAGLIRRLPARWRARIGSSAVRHVGARVVFLSRLVPGSAAVNAVAAASPISTRRFLVAATLGELGFAAGIVALGAGGAELVERSLPAAAAAAALLLAAALVGRSRRRARGCAAAAGGQPATRAGRQHAPDLLHCHIDFLCKLIDSPSRARRRSPPPSGSPAPAATPRSHHTTC